MPVFRITYDIIAPDKSSAQRHANWAPLKVSKVRGPSGKRKRWLVVVNGIPDNRSQTKRDAVQTIRYCKKQDKKFNRNHTYTIIESIYG